MLIVIACGLWFTLVVSPKSSRKNAAIKTAFILRNEKLLDSERTARMASIETNIEAKEVLDDCDKLKKHLFSAITGSERITDDFDERNILIEDEYLGKYLDDESANNLAEKLRLDVLKFAKNNPALSSSLLKNSLFESVETFHNAKVYDMLNELSQIQFVILK
jgi:hypothetical protein